MIQNAQELQHAILEHKPIKHNVFYVLHNIMVGISTSHDLTQRSNNCIFH